MTKRKGSGEESGFGGVFKGLADLIEKLGDLADKGEALKQGEGELRHRDVKGVYGFSVKVGLGDKGDKEVKVEPFGNVRRDDKTGETVVQEMREPVVDVFEEKDHTLVVCEMPGISTKDVTLTVKDDLLTIYAEKRDKKYRKEILLPQNYPQEKMKMTCNNGILEIKCVN
ncbi:MAG: gas vesicle protein GvpH [Deltaproteobacteria bacterium]|nr:gas vesicle protein GvpH [Deltaproteobacteria bacterium]